MGNHQVVPSNIQALRTQNWVQAGQDQENALFSNVNPYRRRLLANVITHQLIEQYELNFITEQDYNSYITELSYRQVKSPSHSINNHNLIYPIRYFVNKSKHQMCTTIHTGYLYADKVELRLKEINDIPFQDLLYMYRATLNGFKTLYEKVGYFDIVEQMIFITKRGEVKVWMNANLAKNYPNYQKTSYASNSSDPAYSQRQVQNIYGSQADMIRKLISMIEKNSDQFAGSDGQQQNQLFSEFLEDKNLFDKLSFQHSLDEFQNYLCQNNLHCPDYMKSIPELFAPDQFAQNAVTNYEQSHVNEITSQHLTQMKKKFQPMETIHQDERLNTKTTNKALNVQNNPIFHQSHVATYNPHSFSNPRQPQFKETQQRKVVRPGQSPFTDLNQSRYSYQSNNVVPNEHGNLNKSINSINTNPHFNQKPNSVSAMNYRQNQPVNFVGQQQCYPSHQNFIFPNHQQIAINEGGYLQSHQQFNNPNRMSQRVVMVSPPPSFRIMGGVPTNLYDQQMLIQQQSIRLPPPSYSPFQQSQISNETNEQNQKNIIRNNINQQTNNLPMMTKVPSTTSNIGQSNTKSSSLTAKQAPSQMQRSSITSSYVNVQQSTVKGTNRREEQNGQKSKIKYFSTKNSYQLDQQIANDLQKFLGLKVD